MARTEFFRRPVIDLILAAAAGVTALPFLAGFGASVANPHLSSRLDPAGAALVGMAVGFMLFTESRLRRLWRRETRTQAEALRRAQLDPLTGLSNNIAFEAALDAGLKSAAPVAIVLLDLDGFRGLLHAHGRRRMEALLSEFARRLAGAVPAGGMVARIHGDEFGLVTSMQDNAELGRYCDGLLRELMQPYFPESRPLQLSLSIGAALLPLHGATVDAGVGAAQYALEAAKEDGGAVWRIFDSRLSDAAGTRQQLRAELRTALANGQMVPYYQPIIHLESGAITGFEILARWRHKVHGLLPPADFIGIAEEQHACGELSLALLRQVIADCQHWPAHWHFAFNTAPGQLRDLIDFVHDPQRLPGDMIDPHRIELEITENALITDMDLARAVVTHMHRGGSRVVLDDFGTGYANFRHLRELDVDGIKIDKSFVLDMADDARSEACVRAILALGKSLEVTVTAEGVETAQVAASLLDMGCTYAQGYYFSPPLPAAEVAEFAARNAQKEASAPI